MFKYFIIFLTALAISSCSNNQVVTNPITGEKPTPGIFSKDASKGISLNQVLNPLKYQSSASSVWSRECASWLSVTKTNWFAFK